MPVSITIRGVPDATRDALAARAARSGRSLQQYLAHELQQIAAAPDLHEWLDAAGRVAARSPRLNVDELLEARDADRT